MTEQRLSDKPYWAEITFTNGEKRRVDYTHFVSGSQSVTFMPGASADGSMLVVVLASVQTIECFASAIPQGSA